MIIHCPECNARYNLTAAQIGADGRTVRCVKCSHKWFQKPIEEEKKEETPPLPPINKDTPKFKAAKKETDKPNKKFIIAIAASVAFIFIGAGLFLLKDNLLFSNHSNSKNEEHQSEMQTSNTGLVIGKVNRSIVEDGDLSILVFTGTITNTNVTSVEVSPIRVSLFNDRGIELDSFPALPNKTILSAGETTEWVCRFFNPPLDKISEFKASFANIEI